MNRDQQIQEAQDRVAAMLAEQKRERDQKAAQEQADKASAPILEEHLKALAYRAIRQGQPWKAVNKAYANSPDKALDLVVLAVVNPLFGLVRQSGMYNFNGTLYQDLPQAATAIDRFLGLSVDSRDLLEILYASLEEDLALPAYRKWAVDKALSQKPLELPEGLTVSDQLRLKGITGTL